MNDPNTELDLFKLGQHYFDAFIQEFAAYGIRGDPEIELRRGTGMLCYYDLKDGHIYLSLPDIQAPEGKLHLLFLRSLVSCQNNEEVLDLFQLLLPHVIAHELAHHFRHRYGLFSDNLWHEEQIANQLAIAVTKHRLSLAERERATFLLKRAMEGLAEKLGLQDVAADSYHSIWEAFGVGGQLEGDELKYMGLAQQFFATDPVEMLKSSGQLSEEIGQRLERREDIIDEINEQYASDHVRYMYYQLGWMYLNLTSPERQYVEAFARQHLDLTVPLLPLIPKASSPQDDRTEQTKEIKSRGFSRLLALIKRQFSQRASPEGVAPSPPPETAILACFKAYRDTLPYSETGGHYFYKRYRASLLALLRSIGEVEQFRQEATFIFQSWEGQEGKADMLAYLAHLAPSSLQELFPHQIAEYPELRLISPQDHLPTETDRRLWQHICLGKEDPEASNILSRLALLDQIRIYRVLPAEAMLELSHNLCRVKLAAGETLIWQGEQSNDVYILIEGKLGAFGADDSQEKALGTIEPGEVFGEMAFFTNEPRQATVRATERSECFVLKDTDLRILAFKYPAIFMQITQILTKRLAEMNV